MKRFVPAALLLMCASLSPAAPRAGLSGPAERIRADVSFLSDDLLEGRDTGSRGHEIAAQFVASRFAALGLRPAGENSTYFQRITFQRTEAGKRSMNSWALAALAAALISSSLASGFP